MRVDFSVMASLWRVSQLRRAYRRRASVLAGIASLAEMFGRSVPPLHGDGFRHAVLFGTKRLHRWRF
jgi:hypothetical protein